MDKYESFHADWESSEGPPNFDMEEHIRDTWSWFRDVLKSPKVPFPELNIPKGLSLLSHQW